jgi:gliding motility-associated-like protein
MPRIGLFCTLFLLTVVRLSAQHQPSSYLEFVQNKGQWDSSVLYKAELDAGSIFIQKNGFTVLQQDTADLRRIHRLLHGEGVGPGTAFGGKPGSGRPDDPYLLHSHVYRVVFENANGHVEVVPDKSQEYAQHFFTRSGGKEAINCGVYLGVVYKNLYDGIDLHYYTEGGNVKYDLVVHPGADPGKISLKYIGQKELVVRKNQVLVRTSVGQVKELEPRSYQSGQQGRTEVSCKYELREGNRLRFRLDNYDPGATLVIDPTEVFCSFTGSRSDNWGYTATYDNAGELFLGGIVLNYSNLSANGFGATTGAFQSTYQGGDASEGTGGQGTTYDYDIGLMKFNAAGTRRIWATYLGGPGDEQPHSLVCDAQGNLIITGRTSSAAFPPVTLPKFGDCGAFDIFVAKLSADGSKLLGAMRIGGKGDDGVNNSPKYRNAFGDGTQELRLNYGDDGRSEVILDGAGNVYVAACTQSLSDFPTTPGAFQTSPGGGAQDGVLLKLTPDLKSVLFSSFIGGSGTDAAFVLAQNPVTGNIYVAGGTMSKDLSGVVAGVYRGSNDGGVDGFISVITPDGSTLLKTTYFGSDGVTDMIYGIGFDKYGFPYITGTTNGVIPVVNSPFNQGGNQANGKQFITKLKPDLSGIVYSANFGPGGTTYPNISPTAFLVDRCQNVYVSGWGGGIDPGDHYNNSGTNGLVATPDAIRTTTDNADFYFFVLKRDAASQLYGSFFGQVEKTDGRGNESLGDHVDGGTSRFDAQGVIYEAICANCGGIATFPTSATAPFRTNGAAGPGGCNEAAVKIQFNFAGVAAGLKVVTHGRGDSVGCVPLTATFSDTIRNAKQYIWDFGDGTNTGLTTAYTEDHTYTSLGTYKIMLIAIDSNSCNVADTAIRYVTVKDHPAFVDFRYDKIGSCESFQYQFTNHSTFSAGAPPFSDTAFTWSYGDGGVDARLKISDKPTHTYPAPGPYKVTLSLVDTSYCNAPMDTTRLLYVTMNDTARFTTPQYGCAPYIAVFSNTSIGGQKFYWDFGDGSGIDSVDYSPTHLYANIGSYTVKLTAIDSTTCNIISTYSFTVTVQGKPHVDFSYVPVPPQPANTPTVFTDASDPGVKYEWFFGDGSSEVKTTPDTVVHLYIRTDTFNVCEVVTNASGCTDTACHAVPAVINPLLDVPNAFTPGRFGVNSVVKVVGFGITHMNWKIYNRWGQLVFESVDPFVGWDGRYHGVIQPMDVYAYTLEASFSDGTHATKKGDITLIR